MEKHLEIIKKKKEQLCVSYGVPDSCVIYIGDNHFIVVKDGKEIKI